ncbi:hypothetical protein V866_000096 [Kwoniella sp. B9012]
MDRMTNDLWETIFQSLDPISLLRCSETCRRFNQVITGSSKIQLILYRYLYQHSTSPHSPTPVHNSLLSSHEQLRNLLQVEKNLSTFKLRKYTLKIGPGELICAAHDGHVISKLEEPRPAREQDGRWRFVVEYTETKDSSGRNAWTRKEHLCDFEPDPERIWIDLARDLIIVKEETEQDVLHILSFRENTKYDWIGVIQFHPGHVTIAIPDNADRQHSLNCLWPDHVVLFLKIPRPGWTSQIDNIGAPFASSIFIYDLTRDHILETSKEEPIIIDRPTYKLFYPSQISDLPSHISDRIYEMNPVCNDLLGVDLEGHYRLNGIIQFTKSINVRTREGGSNTSHRLWILIDAHDLIQSMPMKQDQNKGGSVRDISLEEWYPFSYMHMEQTTNLLGRGPAYPSVSSKKILRWTRKVPRGEVKITCHDLNERVVALSRTSTIHSASMGQGALNRRFEFEELEQGNQQDGKNGENGGYMEEDLLLNNITITRSDNTSHSLGAITRAGTYQPTGDDRRTMLFDGTRVFIQDEIRSLLKQDIIVLG